MMIEERFLEVAATVLGLHDLERSKRPDITDRIGVVLGDGDRSVVTVLPKPEGLRGVREIARRVGGEHHRAVQQLDGPAGDGALWVVIIDRGVIASLRMRAVAIETSHELDVPSPLQAAGLIRCDFGSVILDFAPNKGTAVSVDRGASWRVCPRTAPSLDLAFDHARPIARELLRRRASA